MSKVDFPNLSSIPSWLPHETHVRPSVEYTYLLQKRKEKKGGEKKRRRTAQDHKPSMLRALGACIGEAEVPLVMLDRHADRGTATGDELQHVPDGNLQLKPKVE